MTTLARPAQHTPRALVTGGTGLLGSALVPRLLDVLGRLAADPRMLGRRYRPLCSLTGRDVRVFVGDTIHAGLCRGIDDGGGLVVETDTGRTVVRSGSLTPPGREWRGDDSGA